MKKRLLLCLASALTVAALGAGNVMAAGPTIGWGYNGGPQGDHFSTAKQITPANVSQLQQAWRFDYEAGGLQAQPLIIGRTLYGPTPTGKLVAIDAATGALKWTFDPGFEGTQPIRGLTSHGSGSRMRLLFGSMSYLYAIDPATGKPIPTFGDNGRIDLRENLRGEAKDNAMFLTSPGTVYKDLYIASGRVSESTPASPGDLRAFDVNTGKIRWVFHTIPHPGEPGADTWPKDAHLTQGGANAWSGSAVDVRRGMVFVATGSAADDFYGAERLGDNRFANSLLALDANTGKLLWDFQAIRHDIWDLDFAAPPTLMTVTQNGKKIDAVVVTNKTSRIYAFERATGKPLWPIEDVAVPASDVPGEKAAATQPVPTKPRAFSRTEVTVNDLTTRTIPANIWARGVYSKMNGGGKPFTPFTIGKETFMLTSFTGGVQWGGMAADRGGILYANANNGAGISSMIESASLLETGVGKGAYRTQCANCHGVEMQGQAPDFPAIADIKTRLTNEQIAAVIKNGRGRMPAFSNMPAATVENLISFLTTGKDLPGVRPPPVSLQGRQAPSITKYTSTGNRSFTDPDGFPGVKPPWGTLNAVDMNTGEYLWTVPFGVTGNLSPEFGGSSAGGAAVTASGLLFIGATADRKVRAYDTKTGKVLWENELPAPAQATPAVYMIDGRQYVVISSAGRRGGAGQDNSQAVTAGATQGGYVAFALPK